MNIEEAIESLNKELEPFKQDLVSIGRTTGLSPEEIIVYVGRKRVFLKYHGLVEDGWQGYKVRLEVLGHPRPATEEEEKVLNRCSGCYGQGEVRYKCTFDGRGDLYRLCDDCGGTGKC